MNDDETTKATPETSTTTAPDVPLAALSNARANRRCRECKACCTSLQVNEIQKAEGERCTKLCSKGCSIYSERPQSCADFRCLWLQGAMSDKDRPDKLGLVLDVQDSPKYGRIFKVFEVHAGALTSGRGPVIGKALAQQGLVILFKKDGNRTVVGGPEKAIQAFRNDLVLASMTGNDTYDADKAGEPAQVLGSEMPK